MTTAIATFGKFNITHNGHNSVLEAMANLQTNLYDTEIIVGLSSSNRANRDTFHRLEDYRAICNSDVTYSTCLCSNLYIFCIMLSQAYDTVVLCLGSDRIASTQRLLISAGITNIILHEIERVENAPSSTHLREIYANTNADFEYFTIIAEANGILNDAYSATIAYNAIQEELGLC